MKIFLLAITIFIPIGMTIIIKNREIEEIKEIGDYKNNSLRYVNEKVIEIADNQTKEIERLEKLSDNLINQVNYQEIKAKEKDNKIKKLNRKNIELYRKLDSFGLADKYTKSKLILLNNRKAGH